MMKAVTVELFFSLLVIANCRDVRSSIYNATEAYELISKSPQVEKMPAMKALAYVTAELIFVGGAVVLTPTRLLTRYRPIEDYVRGTLCMRNLRVGIGREEIKANNFPNDYPVMKVVDNKENLSKHDRTALVFIADIYAHEVENFAYPSIFKYSKYKEDMGTAHLITLYYWNKISRPEAFYVGYIVITGRIKRVYVTFNNKTSKEMLEHTKKWPGGFAICSKRVVGIISKRKLDPRYIEAVSLELIHVNGEITPNGAVILEV